MDNDFEIIRPQISDEAKQETLDRAVKFESLTSTPGWELILSYVENQYRTFTNKAVLNGYKDISEFEKDRGIVLGLRGLIGSIQSDLEVLRNERRSRTTN